METKLACEISFQEKAEVFSHDYLKCCEYISRFAPSHPYIFTKKLYSKLVGTSQVLEDFLDFHGAKNNTHWFFYRELSASIRHLSLAGYSQKHILNRLSFYKLPNSREFEEAGEKTLGFLNMCLARLSPVILSEARRLDIPVSKSRFSPADFPGITTSERLPYNIDDLSQEQQKCHVVHIANEFLHITEHFEHFAFYEPYSLANIRALVPEKLNEVQTRQFEMRVHNLQSSFDTYVMHGGVHFGDQRLKSLRSFFSVVFHLFQLMGRLLHFYERHLYERGYKDIYKSVRERLGELVDADILLDRTVNYSLFYACHYLNTGKKLAREILNANIERANIHVGIPVKCGFHARPSMLVAKIVQHYGGQVELVVGDDRFDASSVLDIQWAGGKIHKENIQSVSFEGDARALHDIAILAGVNYGEDIMGKGIPLPKELGYLR